MASFNLFLLPLSFFIFHYHSILLLKADNNLITQLCSKTTDPGTCTSCLEADPSSSTADAKGLTKIAIHCAEKDTTILHDYIFQLYENATDDATLKNLLDDCALQSFKASTEFDGVISDVDASDYGGAKSIVSDQILPSVNFCLDQFDKAPQLPVPPVILAGTHIVDEDCNIVIGILSNI